VLVSALVVLAVFVVLTSLVLEQAFRDSARSAREERLLGQLYLLMAAAEEVDDALTLPPDLAEPGFNFPDSGLYAAVLDALGREVWRSLSALTATPPLDGALPPGERRLDIGRGMDGRDYLVERYGISWAIGPEPAAYTFVVAEDLSAYRQELDRFRTALAGWLGAMSILMLAALLAAVRWGLTPLRQVAAELAAMEQGSADRIRGRYPEELRALTDNLNALLARERARHKRLDEALGDLAHSLKTPLAVMRGTLDECDLANQSAALMDEQLTRMEHIVAHQLQRARAGTATAPVLAAAVPVAKTAERLCATLVRVYRGKMPVRFAVKGDPEATFQGTEGDLMEVLGNLLDNAFKWAAAQVRVGVDRGTGGLEILVEDDGPGVPSDLAEKVLTRGTRADEATPGQGIGLAVARDICEAYGGTLTIDHSPLGGALVRVLLPG
jgi:two-component system sensor histidine kinase PhoQ